MPASPRPTSALIAALAACLLVACTAPPAPEAVPPTPITAPAPPVAARVYTIAPDLSTLHILVYRGGTRTNMLRESLLDGERYPLIRIQSLRLQGDSDTPQVQAALRIRDQTREVTVPVQVRAEDGRLEVRGEFALRQSDFGITPLSVAMGALLVVDTVTVKFHLVGTRP